MLSTYPLVCSQRITTKVNIYLLSLNYYSICNMIRLSVIPCSWLNARMCIFACICSILLYYKMYVLVVYYFMCFNVAYYLVNTLLPRSSFCYGISRTPIEEADNYLTKIFSKNELLNLHGIFIAVIIKSNYLYNGCVWIKKGLWQPEEDFFFVWFFFSSSSGTLRSMKIKRHGHLCPTRVTSLQLAINPATYTSDCDSTSSGRHTFNMETSISCNLWGTWLDNLCFFGAPAFFLF